MESETQYYVGLAFAFLIVSVALLAFIPGTW